MAAQTAKPTLESLVTRYRREVGRGGPGGADGSPNGAPSAPNGLTNIELEVRLQDLDYENFAAIHAALVARLPPGALTQMVGTVADIRRGEGRAEGARMPRAARIREIYFEGGRRVSERYVRKEPLVIPYRVAGAAGLGYIVALAAEAPDREFVADNAALIRVKARASFALRVPASERRGDAFEWRVDATVTRQISGSDAASSLRTITDMMFGRDARGAGGGAGGAGGGAGAPMSAATLLEALRLGDDEPDAAARRALYRYEVEAEFVGPADRRDLLRPADVTAAAAALLGFANPAHAREAALQAEVFRTAQYLVRAPAQLARYAHELGLKRLLPQALAITRADYREIYPPTGHFLYDKTDGQRAVASLHDGRAQVAADELHEFAPPGRADARWQADTRLDGEWVAGVAGDAKSGTFYAFDVIAVAGESLVGEPFERRAARLEEAAALLRAAGAPVAAKVPRRVAGATPAELQRDFRAVLDAPRPYEIDGVIIVEPGRSYAETANRKWKDAAHNTIDCLARRAPASVLGCRPFLDRPGCRLHFLFVGISPELFAALRLQRCPGYADLFGWADRAQQRGADSAYFPVQFAPSDAPLAYLYQHPDGSPLGDVDGKVVELRWRAGGADGADGGPPAWEAVRVREDRRRDLATRRYFGNDFYTAELIWLNYLDPFPAEQLWAGPGDTYFRGERSGVYDAQIAHVSFVKGRRIAALRHAAWVVDVGAGRGQDLGRYLDAEVEHLVAVDRDRAALAELVRRKYSHARRRGLDSEGAGGRGARRRATTTVHVLAADAGAPHAETLAKLEALGAPRGGVDALVCNLAFHYFCGSVETVRNFVALARGLVKPGGLVAITGFRGEAVHAALVGAPAGAGVPPGGTWDISEPPAPGAPPALKFSIRRDYSSDTLEAAGQRIGVLLPFSDGSYYEEYLVNTRAVAAEFAARGFTAAGDTSLATLIPEFETRNRTAAALTPGDRAYLGLFCELVFRRGK